MENREAIEKLERQSKLICHGCMHPSMVGWCENHCQLPEAFNMAISALEKQERKKIIKIAPFGGGNMLSTCPVCGCVLQSPSKYCQECGQHIKAEEEE